MWHLQPRDDHSDSRGVEGSLLGLSDLLGDARAAREQVGIDALPVIDLGARHDQGVPGTDRGDGQECDHLVVLPHEAGR